VYCTEAKFEYNDDIPMWPAPGSCLVYPQHKIVPSTPISPSGGKVIAPDRTGVYLPQYAVDGTVTVSIKTADELTPEEKANVSVAQVDTSAADKKKVKKILEDTLRKIEVKKLADNTKCEEFKKPVRIELPYKDKDNDGKVDGTDIPVDTLRVCRLTEDNGKPEWEIVDDDGYGVDKDKQVVWVNVKHLSMYALAQVDTEETLKEQSLQTEVYVYPNPFVAAEGHTEFVFKGLPNTGSIKIYTLSGELVKEIVIAGGEAKWDARNDDGDEISSGVYVYVVKGEGVTETGKIAVIR
jgi:hypothetical protein